MKKNLSFVVMFLLSMTFIKAQDIKSDLVFYLPCDGITAVDQVGEVEGTINGSLAVEVGFDGKAEGAWNFDGATNSVDFVDSTIVDLPTGGSPRTYAVWLRTTATNITGDMLSYGTQEKGNHVHLAYRISENKIRNGYWYADYDCPATINDDSWHHVVASLSEEKSSLYVDGALVSSYDAVKDPALNTVLNGVFRIGARNNAEMGDKFMGLLDEVRVYSRAFTEEDAYALYEYRPAGPVDLTKNLAFYLKCDDQNFVDEVGKVEGFVNGIIASDIGFDEKPNSSWYFDGISNGVDFIDASVIDLPLGPSLRTLSVWLRTTMTTGASDLISFGTQEKGQHNHFAYRAGENKFRSGHWYADYDWGVTLNDDYWHHVAVSYTETECTLYVDGVGQGAVTLSTDPETMLNTVGNGVLRVGARNDTDLNDKYTGFLDEVRIYNRTLTDEEITALFEFRPQAPTKVTELNMDNFKVYPTLVESTLNISSNVAISALYVMDMSGKIVLQSKMQNNIDVSSLPNGIYFVKGIGAKTNYSAKFIKR